MKSEKKKKRPEIRKEWKEEVLAAVEGEKKEIERRVRRRKRREGCGVKHGIMGLPFAVRFAFSFLFFVAVSPELVLVFQRNAEKEKRERQCCVRCEKVVVV